MTKRDAILKAADQLFAKSGFGMTGVDALATAAGVTKRTLYKQFGSKEALFVGWLKLRDERTRGSLLRAVQANTDDPKGQLLALFQVLGTLSASPNFHGCPFTRALYEINGELVQSAAREVAREHKAILLRWFIERLQAAGFSESSDLAEEIATLYEGTLARVATTGSPVAAQAAVRLLSQRLEAMKPKPL